METLKNLSFSVVLFLIGAIFFLLGLSGGLTVGGNSLLIQDTTAKTLALIAGALFVAIAVYLEIKERITNTKSEVKSHEETRESEKKGLVVKNVYLSRKQVHWPSYDNQISRRFWVVGTSLRSVIERGIIQDYLRRGVRDIKVILPQTHSSFLSSEQLREFDRQSSGLLDNQNQLAAESFKKLSSLSPLLANFGVNSVVKQYGGIMYANISIFDDDAFISFYNTTGIGDNNFTLHFNKAVNETGYALVEQEFQRMWEVPSEFGKWNCKKQMGTSILFVNKLGKILLSLRDNKPTIPYPNCWDILGGKIEEGETPLECIKREMLEEINVRLENPQLFDVYNLDDRLEFTFWKGVEFNIESLTLTEGQRLKWFTEKDVIDLPENVIAFGFKPIILSFFKKKPFGVSINVKIPE